MINIDEFSKVEIRVGQILEVEKIENTDKLLKLLVDLGEENKRQIVSGIALYFPNLSVLKNKKCLFVANLEPRVIKGYESNGMICALSDEEGNFSLIVPEKDMKVGTKIK